MLNPSQKEAVEYNGGPLIVAAGAGSGKTRVLTHRIAWLIQEGLAPHKILAITFTNKAADEMKERVKNLVDEGGMWVSTFHSSCLRILRQEAERLGYARGFSIYDQSDVVKIVRDVMRDQGFDTKQENPAGFAAKISAYKNKGIEVNELPDNELTGVYAEYEKRIKAANAMDFDDILLNTLRLFTQFEGVLDYWRNRFDHILVDEYQDTNVVQNRIVTLLAEEHQQITVVGDTQQSIYRFRGADFRNLLDFKETFKNAKLIKLEQNYRSTPQVLESANKVITNNTQREDVTLWTENAEGKEVQIVEHTDERAEAYWLANTIKKHGVWSDIAVFYRTNAISRILEEVFTDERIPHKVIGGQRFFERKEIKDILAWLKFMQNPNDIIAAMRALSSPKRGIGEKTIAKLDQGGGMFTLYDSMKSAVGTSKTGQAFKDFIEAMEDARFAGPEPAKILIEILQRSGYVDWLESEDTPDAHRRIENLQELVASATEYRTVTEYLEHISLLSDTEQIDEEDTVKLMTVHTSKGLEFPWVFVVGMEEGLFPHSRSMGEEEEIEEERRLAYVAITRAESRLYLSFCESRRIFNTSYVNPPSRFLREVGYNAIPEPGFASQWKPGDKVSHKIHGEGVVTEIREDGLTIETSTRVLRVDKQFVKAMVKRMEQE